ncbi:uncharacterized protein F5147DRAFT_785088 [Suillus discolor]|uniref:Ribonuclease H1 N-terminal domain-containing protein n=1 Tax=Suillus discolor TaxID=1912936 RepID=A0A9P7EPM3_9AGAM|nr:uncharacterized protein F5147DRAFT_785088 [Suillus discolor]KAG2079414.1 hypothetical protein F5147DRAFT_785088 [Suillus discolor]
MQYVEQCITGSLRCLINGPAGSRPVQRFKSGGSPSPSSDPGYSAIFSVVQDIEDGQKYSTLVGPGVLPRPHAQCCPALSVAYTPPSTVGSSTIAPIPPPLPDSPLTSATGAIFRLPETLPLTVTPYFAGEADADVRWVKRDQALYKELVGAIANDCYVYLYHEILYNMPAVPGKSGPYYCVTRGRYIGVFNHWDEVAENIEGFLMWFMPLLRSPLEKYFFALQ